MKILINTEWFSAIQDLPKEKQLEILEAIMDYPNRESDTNIWKKVIKPQLETGKIAYYNKINNLKQYRSTERVTDTDTDSVTDTDTRTESNINKYNINNNNNINNYSNSISNNNTTHVRTHVRDKEPITSAEVNKIVKGLAQNFRSADAIVGAFEYEDGKTHEGIKINNQRLLAFIRKRFDSGILEKVSNWAIDHNQRGYVYNAQALLKLLTRFQRDVEPTINFNFVQNEYVDFQYKTDSENNGKPAENKEK